MTTAQTGSLFDEALEPDFALTSVLAEREPTSAGEKEFHRLAARIEALRGQLKHWQAYRARFNQRLAAEMTPLRAQLIASQRLLALLIDELLSSTTPGERPGRGQRAKLRQLLVSVVGELLGEIEDPELEALHDKYSDLSLEEMTQSKIDLTQEMLKEVFGVDVGDDHGARSAEELFERARRAMHEEDERKAARRAEARPSHPQSRRSRTRRAQGEAGEAERRKAAAEITQSLREVYRRLVSALHPDREPEAQARERKTRLMQRVNQAYEANDILTLLGLQLEIEQIDAAHLASVPPQRLAHYNQILREQLSGLEGELERFIAPFREMLGSVGRGSLTPALVDRQLSADLAQRRRAVRSLEEDRIALRDPRRRAEWLRHYRLDTDEEEQDGEDLARLIGFLDEPPPRRGRRRRRK